MKKKSSTWSQSLVSLLWVVPSIVNIISQFISCLEYEAYQAQRSLRKLIILSMIAIMLAVGAWLCVCALAYLWLQTTGLTPIVSLSILIASHLVLLLIVALSMARAKDKMLFLHTRELLHQCQQASCHCHQCDDD